MGMLRERCGSDLVRMRYTGMAWGRRVYSSGFWAGKTVGMEMVNSMLSYSGLSKGFWGEAMLTACYVINMVSNKGARLKHMNFESRDKIFDENYFSSIPRPKVVVQNLEESQRDDHSDNIPSEIPEPQKEYPRTYNEDMQSRDIAFWKKAIHDEIGSIIGNDMWALSDLPPGCKPLGIEKFKARLLIQDFRRKKRIDYFDTHALIARITTIRLLLALTAIHNLVIHQMDVKTTFLNDDMLIFKTDQNQVDKTKKLLSSRFSMKDIGEVDVILGVKIKRENKGIVITQSHYIEKISKKFNLEDCSSVSTLMNPVEKLKPNTGKPVDQLEYSRAIGCLMYAMTSTRPDIAYAIDRLSRFTSNPSRQHWKGITRASKKQTCITSSAMKYEFVALVVDGKEAEWLRNLINEIPIWPKLIAPISIRCDSAPKMAKSYNQVFNGKSKHFGVTHSMIRKLIMKV
uniref:Reverse transcriptase Ty1/copia-type domain-containing protein n=1 Tax=Tanacetum cinerariifolium TaxID=118510 RepID=A0A6L2NVB7_TANCI|nr:hypothetical protein [Tanacetum cinerariifolium]